MLLFFLFILSQIVARGGVHDKSHTSRRSGRRFHPDATTRFHISRKIFCTRRTTEAEASRSVSISLATFYLAVKPATEASPLLVCLGRRAASCRASPAASRSMSMRRAALGVKRLLRASKNKRLHHTAAATATATDCHLRRRRQCWR